MHTIGPAGPGRVVISLLADGVGCGPGDGPQPGATRVACRAESAIAGPRTDGRELSPATPRVNRELVKDSDCGTSRLTREGRRFTQRRRGSRDAERRIPRRRLGRGIRNLLPGFDSFTPSELLTPRSLLCSQDCQTGQRAIFSVFSLPLCVLCVLCGEYVLLRCGSAALCLCPLCVSA
jgi:hypothetical protein